MNMQHVNKAEFMTEKEIVNFFQHQPLIARSVRKAPHSEKWYNGAYARRVLATKNLRPLP